MASHIDPQLAEKILHEVKSQGVFDEFRKDSIADVDTKPAYQNLRQRVENAVQKFLSEQKWTPETNKHQLRERLRRHIVESGFFDVGVERIVDQVVNPKIGSVFQPRIEEIAYKFLGISPPLPTKREPPPLPPMPPLPPVPHPMNGSPLKVETDASFNLLPTDLEQVSPDSDKMKEEDMVLEEKADDDDESPPFEPLTECKSPKSEVTVKKEENTEKETANIEPKKEVIEKVEGIKVENIKSEDSCALKEKNSPNDALVSQESQLSQVSSDSRLSSVSNQLLQKGNNDSSALDQADVNISEEAQMPKFNENSIGTDDSVKSTTELHFDIKKDEIKFEGTERKTNILDGDGAEFTQETRPIKDAYVSDSLGIKGSFHFTKLNVDVEPCNITRGGASSISSQDDTSSAQLCIVERPENELNSIQKCSQEDSSTNTTITNSQLKQKDSKSDRNGKHYSSSSSSSSRLKKSTSKDKKHSSERSQKYDDKDRDRTKNRDRDQERDRGRDRERYRERDRERERHGDAKHSSKTSSSSSRRHESSDKHKRSSGRSEKDQHLSSSSRSESRSRHKSSKRDHRDKYDKKKSHKSSSSSKEHRSEERKSRTDDHNQSREKIRWRKSTDSNDEDKNPSSQSANNNTTRSNKSSNDTESTANANSKSTSNGSNKHHKESSKNENKNVDSTKSYSEHATKVSSSRVVILNEVLENPATNFIELETKSTVQVITQRRSPTPSSETNDVDLLYFEQSNSQFQARLDLLNDAIDRCRNVINAATCAERMEHDEVFEERNDQHSTSKESACPDDAEAENSIEHGETKATLLVDCYHYNNCSDQNAVENMEETSSKRLKYSTECNIAKIPTISDMNVCTKENQMKEKNTIMTDEDNKKPTLSKRIDTLTKLTQQQRYSSEDLYKPRPVLGQRSKRRGLDTVI